MRSPTSKALQRIVEDEAFDDASQVCLQQQLIHGALTPLLVVVIHRTDERERKLRKIAASEGLELSNTGPGMADRYVLMQH
jgi:hypothetical protein